MLKKLISIIVIAIFLVVGITSLNSKNKTNKKESISVTRVSSKKPNSLIKRKFNIEKIYNNFDLFSKDNNLKRCVVCKEYSDEIFLYIGNNEKEIQNKYYDFCFKVSKNSIVEVYINKLWKHTYNEKLYDESYIQELVETVDKLLSLELSKEQLLTFKNNLKDNYTKQKKNLREKGQESFINLQLDDLDIIYSDFEGDLKLELKYV